MPAGTPGHEAGVWEGDGGAFLESSPLAGVGWAPCAAVLWVEAVAMLETPVPDV